MAAIESHAEVASAPEGGLASFPAVAAVVEWTASADHKKTGRLMAGVAVVASLAIVAIGAVLSFERIDAESATIVDAAAAPQVLELFRFGLVFVLLAPLVLGIALAIVPLQVGSRAVSYGRLAQFGVWSWIFGVALVVLALLGNGGPGGGDADFVDLHMLGLGLVLAGLWSVAVCLVVTVLTSRAPGMDLMDAPAFAWAALVAGFAMVVVFPVAIGSIIYSFVLHTYGVSTNPETVLAAGTFPDWLFGQPTTLIFAVLAVGFLAEVAPVVFGVRQPARPAVLVGLGVMSTAVLAGITQTAHVVDVTGADSTADTIQDALLWALFNGLPVLGILVVLGAVGLASKAGKLAVRGPLVAATLGTLVVLAGAAANAVQHIVDFEVVDTAFGDGVNALNAYGTLAAAIGAVAWWLPKWSGRTISDLQVAGLGAAAAIGGLLAGAASIVAGFADQPASVIEGFDYEGPAGLWNAVAAAGHGLAALALLGLVAQIVASRKSAPAGDDPWDGHTLEWAVPSPAPADNFAELATVGSAEPVLDAKPASTGSKVGS